MKRILHFILYIVSCGSLLLGVTACEQATVSTPTPTTLTLAGATAMQPVLHDLTVEFSRQHPSVLFNWLGGSSATGEERIQTEEIDLAASTFLDTKPMSATTMAKGGPSIVRIPIGLDGLAIIVHPSNPIENVTLRQLHDLFNGHLLDWSMLGSSSGGVILISREDGSGSRRLFEERVMGDDQVSLTAVVMPTSADVVDYVAQNAGAIGYVSRAYVIDALRAQTDKTTQGAVKAQTAQVGATSRPAVRVVRVENQFPTLENLKNQSYFFTQPLFLLSRGQPRGWARQFIDFVLSPAGQTIVERYHARVR
ncbi:MAG: phosphate ABC transporter substrate-binding protein [Caldilineaceae bacterium]